MKILSNWTMHHVPSATILPVGTRFLSTTNQYFSTNFFLVESTGIHFSQCSLSFFGRHSEYLNVLRISILMPVWPRFVISSLATLLFFLQFSIQFFIIICTKFDVAGLSKWVSEFRIRKRKCCDDYTCRSDPGNIFVSTSILGIWRRVR